MMSNTNITSMKGTILMSLMLRRRELREGAEDMGWPSR
jgi:hypothetical protein